jgi:hypothetical protein
MSTRIINASGAPMWEILPNSGNSLEAWHKQTQDRCLSIQGPWNRKYCQKALRNGRVFSFFSPKNCVVPRTPTQGDASVLRVLKRVSQASAIYTCGHLMMSTPDTIETEKRRGRPKGSTIAISKGKDLFHKQHKLTVPHDPYDPYGNCVCDLSGLPLPAAGHLDSCTRAVGSDAAKADPGARLVIIDLEDDDTDGTDGDLPLSAFSRHGKFIEETDLKSLREANSSTPRPVKRRRKKASCLYNPASIASDILRAAGIHPTLPPLNWHLLEKK